MWDEEDIEFMLTEWTQSGTFTISRSELYEPGANEPSFTPAVEVTSSENIRVTTNASMLDWLREFVENASVAGYSFPLYAQQQLINSIKSTVVSDIVVSDGVTGFGLVLEYSADNENSEIAKIVYQIVECRERIELLTEEEASEIGQKAGRYVTGVDTDIMFESVIYSQEREDASAGIVGMVQSAIG